MKYVSLLFIFSGFGLMVLAIIRFHRLLRYSRESAYGQARRNYLEYALLSILYLFSVGYLVGAFHVMFYEVDFFYYFVTFIFLLGALFVLGMVWAQERLATDLRKKNMEIMKACVSALEMKDRYTRGHSQHVYNLTRVFYYVLPEETQDSIRLSHLLDAAMLHDIGKLSVSDTILNKPDKLTAEEFEVIKLHPRMGKQMLDQTYFCEISDWVLYHHERVDGNGYYGMAAVDIPIESQILAIADTYSALCTDRIYRPKCTHDEAREIMLKESGKQLNAYLLRLFFTIDRDEIEAAAITRI